MIIRVFFAYKIFILSFSCALYSCDFNNIILNNNFFNFKINHEYAQDLENNLKSFQDLIVVEYNIANNNLNNIKKILIKNCHNFLVVLPKQMGCIVCQFSHNFIHSDRYKHYLKRKKEIEKLIILLEEKDSSIEDIIFYLKNKIKPFKGNYGKSFISQCFLLLSEN
jgi:hypothetical protein